jgi:hypothetical protein
VDHLYVVAAATVTDVHDTGAVIDLQDDRPHSRQVV